MINRIKIHPLVVIFVAATILVSSTGCIGGIAQLIYVIRGHKSPAAFKGLEGKKVAVVVLSDESAYGADTLTYTVGKTISINLSQYVKNIEVVPPSRIEDWIDNNGFNESRFVEIGKGVDAQMVVAVEIGSYTIHDGATLYKGSSNLSVTVYDIENNGQVMFSRGPNEYTFPKNGRPAIQTSDRQFEQLYLAKLTKHVSQLFYPHDQLESVAEDAAMPF